MSPQQKAKATKRSRSLRRREAGVGETVGVAAVNIMVSPGGCGMRITVAERQCTFAKGWAVGELSRACRRLR
jgi:hypothetical protein